MLNLGRVFLIHGRKRTGGKWLLHKGKFIQNFKTILLFLRSCPTFLGVNSFSFLFFFIYFLWGTGAWTWGLHFQSLHQPYFFCEGFFEIGSH
jgi:hypothetical protein